MDPANYEYEINPSIYSDDVGKGIKNAFTNARIGLSKMFPVIRNTKDKDYPLWPLIKFVRRRMSPDNFESPKLAVLREISNILLSNNSMPNYINNNDFREYNYHNINQNILTPIEKQVLNIIAKPNYGIIYGNVRLIYLYIHHLLKFYEDYKNDNPTTIKADDIIDIMMSINIKQIIKNDHKKIKQTMEELQHIYDRINKTQPHQSSNTYRSNTLPHTPTSMKSVVKVEEEEEEEKKLNCPSAGIKPTKEKDYKEQLLLFHPDKNTGCEKKDIVNRKFIKLQELFGKANTSGGTSRTHKKASQTYKKASRKHKKASRTHK